MKSKGWQLSSIAKSRLKKRYRKEIRLKVYGQLAIFIALGVLVILLVSVIIRGHSAFTKTEIALDLTLDSNLIQMRIQHKISPVLLICSILLCYYSTEFI